MSYLITVFIARAKKGSPVDRNGRESTMIKAILGEIKVEELASWVTMHK
jgi:hypothetical protein